VTLLRWTDASTAWTQPDNVPLGLRLRLRLGLGFAMDRGNGRVGQSGLM